jgi:hypothetical protein
VVARLGWRGLIAVAAGWVAFAIGFVGTVVFVAVVAPDAVPSPGGEVPEAMLYPTVWAGTVALGAYQFGLMGVMRQAVLQDEDPGGFFSILVQSLRRLPNTTMAMIVVAVAQMLLVCPAGLLVKDWGLPAAGVLGFALLAPFVYLSGARDDAPLPDSFKESVGWLRRHGLTIAGTYAALLVMALVLWGLWMMLADPVEALVRIPTTGVGRSAVYLGVGLLWWMAVQILYFVPLASLLYTIDAEENEFDSGA